MCKKDCSGEGKVAQDWGEWTKEEVKEAQEAQALTQGGCGVASAQSLREPHKTPGTRSPNPRQIGIKQSYVLPGTCGSL